MKQYTFLKCALSTGLMVALSYAAFAQSGKKANCKYDRNEVDALTKQRVVKTEEKVLYDKRDHESWDLTELLADSYRMAVWIHGLNVNGVNGIEFNYAAYNAPRDFVDAYNRVDFLFENNEVITLKDEPTSTMTLKDGWETNTKVFLFENDSEWQKLKTTPVAKIRIYQTDHHERVLELERRYATRLMDAIQCIDALEIPKSQIQPVAEKKPLMEAEKPLPLPSKTLPVADKTATNNEPQMIKVSQSNVAHILGITSASIYRSWRQVATIQKDGSVRNLDQPSITEFSTDGTYSTTTTLTTGKQSVVKGKFYLVNNDTILVMVSEDGKNHTATISRLTPNEMDLKWDDNTALYIIN